MNDETTLLNRWAAEPFRVFFPLAVLMGILGVCMWPLYFFGGISFYPGMNHSRVMTFGFFGGFMMGFLFTSLPRLLDAKPLRKGELLLVLLLYLTISVCHFLGATNVGESLVVAWVLGCLGVMIPRIVKGADLPPPGFVLVLMGFVCALFAALISLFADGDEWDARWLVLRQILVFQGFLIFPLTGVGGFILPRILGLPEHHDFPQTRVPSKAWLRQFWGSLAVGLVILGSFWLELLGQFRVAYGLRFIAVTIYLSRLVPWWQAPKKGSFVWCLRFGLGSFVAALLFVASFPEWRLPFIHLGFGIGLALISFVVGSRVVLGHRDELIAMEGRQKWMLWVFGLVFVGITSRMIGDFIPRILVSHYNYGALFWGFGAILWWYRLMRGRKAKASESPVEESQA